AAAPPPPPPHAALARPQPEVTALDYGSGEASHHVAAACVRRKLEVQPPRAPRLLDLFELLEPALRLCHLRLERLRLAPAEIDAVARLLAPRAEQRPEAVTFLDEARVCTLLPVKHERSLACIVRVRACVLRHLARLRL